MLRLLSIGVVVVYYSTKYVYYTPRRRSTDVAVASVPDDEATVPASKLGTSTDPGDEA